MAIPNGDIVPYFQPVVRVDTGELDGFEVLARWPHRERGMISPVDFIPVAEDAGLVDAMFWALLAQACRKALDAPGEFILAVNISPSQIRDQWFPEKVLRTLRETGFPAQRLEIEVTESAMIGDVARAKSSLMSLKNQGVRVALDDFGTGYSSLFLLRELPIDKLKIDRSFVARITTDRENATIVGALVGLGKALGLEGDGRRRRGRSDGRSAARHGLRVGARLSLRRAQLSCPNTILCRFALLADYAAW